MALAEAVHDGWYRASLLVLAAILDTLAIGDGDGLPSAVFIRKHENHLFHT